mmetsp:Transcript_45329/g.98630  ORF Transcript_45329/g.98630 Transcript_45329/m.98630 type:complete len:444 (+) Transcript_45329:330-1661(+)
MGRGRAEPREGGPHQGAARLAPIRHRRAPQLRRARRGLVHCAGEQAARPRPGSRRAHPGGRLARNAGASCSCGHRRAERACQEPRGRARAGGRCERRAQRRHLHEAQRNGARAQAQGAARARPQRAQNYRRDATHRHQGPTGARRDQHGGGRQARDGAARAEAADGQDGEGGGPAHAESQQAPDRPRGAGGCERHALQRELAAHQRAEEQAGRDRGHPGRGSADGEASRRADAQDERHRGAEARGRLAAREAQGGGRESGGRDRGAAPRARVGAQDDRRHGARARCAEQKSGQGCWRDAAAGGSAQDQREHQAKPRDRDRRVPFCIATAVAHHQKAPGREEQVRERLGRGAGEAHAGDGRGQGARDLGAAAAEENCGGRGQAEAAAEPVRGRALRPQPLLQEPHRVAGGDRGDEAQVQDHDAPDRAAQRGDPAARRCARQGAL